MAANFPGQNRNLPGFFGPSLPKQILVFERHVYDNWLLRVYSVLGKGKFVILLTEKKPGSDDHSFIVGMFKNNRADWKKTYEKSPSLQHVVFSYKFKKAFGDFRELAKTHDVVDS
jgi:hypothetical protein